jgi:hypothetical protein
MGGVRGKKEIVDPGGRLRFRVSLLTGAAAAPAESGFISARDLSWQHGKALLPSLRIGYAVLPLPLVGEFAELRAAVDARSL